jgi:hypothetical protein
MSDNSPQIRRLVLCLLCCGVTTEAFACNEPPIAEICSAWTPYHQSVCLGTVVRLDGSWSYDPDGWIYTYEWRRYKHNGSYYQYETSTQGSPVFWRCTSTGRYKWELWVQDDDYAWCDWPDTCYVDVVEVDLDGGGHILLNKSDNLDTISLSIDPDLDFGEVRLSKSTSPGEDGDVSVYYDSAGTNEVTLPKGWLLSRGPIPSTLYVKGTSASSALEDVTLTLSYIQSSETVDSDAICYTVVDVEVTNIKFDHTSGDSSDAIDIREDNTTDISVPEWVKGGQNKPAAYKKSTSVSVKARFTVSPSTITSAKISATASGTGTILGNLAETTVTFSQGVSSPEYVQLAAGTTASAVGIGNLTWQWKVRDIQGSGSQECQFDSSGAHKIYTVLTTPCWPQTEPWAQVLDYACAWAANVSDGAAAVTSITTGAYNGFGKDYDGSQSHTPGTTCHLTAMLADSVVDCRDMSAVVQLFTQVIGVSGTQVLTVWGPFWYKPILPIGYSQWGTGGWNFHQFGWYGNVYDACVMLNQTAPYIPTNANLNGTYKTDLFNSGYWTPGTPFSITSLD